MQLPDPRSADDVLRARLAELLRELYRQAATVAGGVAAGSGLHATDVNALRALDAAADAALTVSALGRRLQLTSGATTALVDRLERHGLVERRRDQADRRLVRVHLTAEARKLGAELLAPVARRIEGAVGGLAPDELAVVERFLTAVVGEPPPVPDH